MRTIFKKVISVVVAFVMILSASGCSKVQPEPKVTLDEVNASPEYCARGFIESIFYDDRNMFNSLFPNNTMALLNESIDDDIFTRYQNAFSEIGEFYGTKIDSSKDFSEEIDVDTTSLRKDISDCHDVSIEDIGSIYIVGLNCFFVIDGKEMMNRVYVIVYEVSGSWYFYELENSEENS